MVDALAVKDALIRLSDAMAENEALLTRIDSEAGDGDLGISMKGGFAAMAETAAKSGAADIGALLLICAMTFNEAAPSTLGTILSVGIMAAGKALKGKTACGTAELVSAFEAGLDAIMLRAKSKPGEKTILDALVPAKDALAQAAAKGLTEREAAVLAAQAAADGCEATKRMAAVHGRAAYYAKDSIGRTDGGATAAKIMFAALAQI